MSSLNHLTEIQAKIYLPHMQWRKSYLAGPGRSVHVYYYSP